MPHKPNILVVCGKNKRRSRTAEHIFKNDARLHIRSAGLSPKSNRKISEKDMQWADLVLVMESEHRARIWDLFGKSDQPEIRVLHIPDVYDYMDEELIKILKDKIQELFNENDDRLSIR